MCFLLQNWIKIFIFKHPYLGGAKEAVKQTLNQYYQQEGKTENQKQWLILPPNLIRLWNLVYEF